MAIFEKHDYPHDPRMTVGTLRYTLAGLITLFVWLLWGDFCFTVMEYVNNSIVPLRLKQLEAPDWVLPIILTTVPSTINFILNPIISTISDRHRGRWGRRIPFLLFSAPFLGLTLALMAFSPELSVWLHRVAGAAGGWSLVAVSIFTVGLLLATFKVFDMFVNTTYWYLFNDVVPQAFMARIMGMLRVVSSTAAMLYNVFFYEHALTHMRAIYLGAAVIYTVGFSLMCFFVKEGKYPPPPPKPPKEEAPLGRMGRQVVGYVKECLSHRVFVYYFMMTALMTLANAIGIFGLYLNLSLGITLAQLGRINAGIQIVQMIVSYPAGALADRFHPLRMWLVMLGCLLVIAPLNFIWLCGTYTPTQAYHIVIGLTAVDFPITTLLGAVGMPLMMRILPRQKFGQFCSFNAIASATMNILGSLAVAWFMPAMRTLLPDATWGKDFCYRMIPAWRIPFLVLALVCCVLLLREWKRLGGEKHYTPPGQPDDEPAPAPDGAPLAPH